ncbi:hypothetical protein C2E23DRAFT_858962 [Lenzites betulinus]|nr:hypothetical protein C2E23DRAFT_858962 [Lenzites betulinus]
MMLIKLHAAGQAPRVSRRWQVYVHPGWKLQQQVGAAAKGQARTLWARRHADSIQDEAQNIAGTSFPADAVFDDPAYNGISLVGSSTYDEPEPIGDDDWVDCDVDQEQPDDGPPAAQTPLATLFTASTSGSGVTVAAENLATSPIPLNADAMAHVDDPDPFSIPLSFLAAARWSVWHSAHPSVVLAMMLTAWLHLCAHLPYRFCDVILTVIGFILAEAGQAHLVPQLRSSLHGCISALRLDPHIRLYPTCPQCLEPHPESVTANVNSRCSVCKHPLFKLESPIPAKGQWKRRRKGKQLPKAYLSTPAKTITEQLADILLQPGMEDAMSSWRRRSRVTGWLSDFFDGQISKVILGPDGLPFFRRDLPEDPDDEIRLGFALGVDWFSYLRSQITASYTSCPMSFNIVNLPPYLRETDPDQTQRYLRVLVNELIRLWHVGVVLPTYRNPQGRRVRVALIGVFCDKPAAHKIGGFGSHAHTFFCTRDWITQGLKATAAAFARGGVVKTHFYHIWVQLKIFRKTKEIRRLHEILDKLNLPSKLGRLPRLVGEPAGGSLTADQWLNLATTVALLALPELWNQAFSVSDAAQEDAFLAQRRASIQKVLASRKAQQLAKRKKRQSTATSKQNPKVSSSSETTRRSTRVRRPTEKGKDMVLEPDDAGAHEDDGDDAWLDDDSEESTRASQLHPRDLSNFFKLCTAVQLFLSDSINFVLDYGPLRGFWTFVFERLNKILKGYHTNNHEGGEIEGTFFREFHRSAQLHSMLTEGVQHTDRESYKAASRLMMDATSDHRGTLQQLADELDAEYEDGASPAT